MQSGYLGSAVGWSGLLALFSEVCFKVTSLSYLHNRMLPKKPALELGVKCVICIILFNSWNTTICCLWYDEDVWICALHSVRARTLHRSQRRSCAKTNLSFSGGVGHWREIPGAHRYCGGTEHRAQCPSTSLASRKPSVQFPAPGETVLGWVWFPWSICCH